MTSFSECIPLRVMNISAKKELNRIIVELKQILYSLYINIRPIN